ncbi:head-tail joining protein [Bradyrhizobium retamae]|uniref:Uncharacterized protein n=1 Tax=Bradyrhizobium retamae TaxID=1300035 RepID=A0A0R3MGL8_9BRAD|nr:hypothetical protein [Bradyrhizobium retamae]KRR16869.1 hypothetical protein CQ13_36545 [Bradyrhizobium retamae]
MANPLFARLPGIFVQTFGEPVIYTPVATGVPVGEDGKIRAIWTDGSDVVAVGSEAQATIGTSTLSVKAADVTPVEGDVATREDDGKTMKVTEPILPDGKGMIRCNLADIA